jgi:hypothetical protein
MMVATTKRMDVLNMIRDGRIDSKTGVELITALSTSTTALAGKPTHLHNSQSYRVKVVVTDLMSGRGRINLRLPANLVLTTLKSGNHCSPEIRKINPDRLLESIRNGQIGKIVDVIDNADQERIEIYLE